MSKQPQIVPQLERTYTELDASFYAKQPARKVEQPAIFVYNADLAEELGLKLNEEQIVNYLSGNEVIPQTEPFAQAYAGHQFGHFTVLGDGRALVLGEILSNGQRFDIQLKGSGRTPYSRGGDGLATLPSILREYVVSEAMYHLGVPTTRSLCVIETKDEVQRKTLHPAAILTRVAASHIRIGTFEFAAMTGLQQLKQLFNYTIKRHYPHLASRPDSAAEFLAEVMNRQIDLIANLWRVGFIHGVMNTDNILISGQTIDYGPCAFMNAYSKHRVYSSIDVRGRYAFGNQPAILKWNLARLAEAILSLIDDDGDEATNLAQNLLDSFDEKMDTAWLAMMRQKLGILTEQQEDFELINDFLKLLEINQRDYTNSFYALSATKDFAITDHEKNWQKRWLARIGNQSPKDTTRAMKTANPAVIPRNHNVENAIRDHAKFNRLLEIIKKPYNYNKVAKTYQQPPESEAGYKTYCGT